MRLCCLRKLRCIAGGPLRALKQLYAHDASLPSIVTTLTTVSPYIGQTCNSMCFALLIMCPAWQVCQHLEAIAKPAGVAVVPILGGMAMQKQARLLSYRPPVVVATPGRLWELMRDGQEHLTDLAGLSFLVLDEADRMLQQGHFQVWV